MPRLLVIVLVLVATLDVFEGSQPVLQRTVQSLFLERSGAEPGGACRCVRASARQSRQCRREPGLAAVLASAKLHAVDACEDAFRYDRWNCSAALNKRALFSGVYRETALVFALVAASLSHAAARACASGALRRCPCAGGRARSWQLGGCGDDLAHGRRVARNFLEVSRAGADATAEAVRQDALVGVAAVGQQLKEVCKCHGFSGSCTTKTCWKRLSPFASIMGAMKKHYHHAVKKKVDNYTSKRAISGKARKRQRESKRSLVYLQKSPNLCARTRGRECRDAGNCGTLCCGRGYWRRRRAAAVRCGCRMVNCCFVECDTCTQDVEYFVCK